MHAPRRILILGCDGQLGRELVRSFSPLGDVIPAARTAGDRPGHRSIDLEQLETIPGALADVSPDLIVNAAAYTAVDRAEDEPERAEAVNASAPGEIARFATQRDVPLVHYSTDYVFAGDGDRPRREDDPIGPLGVYGRTKVRGEQAVRDAGARHLIFRTAWVYADRGRNFLRAILARAGSGGGLRVVDDQTGSPTSAQFLAQASALAVSRWLDRGAVGGTYHLTASGQCTWYDFAREIVALRFGREHDVEIVPVPSSEYPTRAERPRFSVLDCRRFDADFGLYRPAWQAQLRCVLEPGGTQ